MAGIVAHQSMETLHVTALHPLHVCHECDTIQRVPTLAPGTVAHCRVCGAHLFSNPRGGLNTPLALMLGATLLFILANAYPLITLDLNGLRHTTSLGGASLALWRNERPLLAAVVGFTTVLGPALLIFGTTYVLAALRWHRRMAGVATLLSWITRFQPWGMLDVFMLGVLVALVKLGSMAEIVPGVGLFAFAILIFVFAAAASTLDAHLLWDSYEDLR
ncbi:MAG: paraquat-inducible protein A [Chromatiales bacterium]|nr:paraquat-inducible protein A [Chromatiales bacterium]